MAKGAAKVPMLVERHTFGHDVHVLVCPRALREGAVLGVVEVILALRVRDPARTRVRGAREAVA